MYKNFPHAMKLGCARAIPDSLPVQFLEKLPVQLVGHSCEHLQLQTKAMLIQAIACVGRCRMVIAVTAYRPRLCGPLSSAFAPVRAGFFTSAKRVEIPLCSAHGSVCAPCRIGHPVPRDGDCEFLHSFYRDI